MDYLDLWVTRECVRPKSRKVESIVDISLPRNKKQVHVFILMITYYRNMWYRMSHTLQVLTKLTSVCVKFKWTSLEQDAFELIKKNVEE